MKVLPLAVLTLLAAGELQAQQVRHARFDAPAGHGLATDAAAAPTVLEAASEDAFARDRSERGFLMTAAHVLGGALVGGWVGYVGAQVAKSDWDKSENGAFATQRTRWAATGAVVGVIGSGLLGRTRSPRAPREPVRRAPAQDRTVLTFEEIRASSANNAYQLIEILRKDWLIPRGTNSVGESPRGFAGGMGSDMVIAVTPGRDKILVYLDDVRIGGVEELNMIAVENVESARFLDARQATLRFGSGHGHGVIQLFTRKS